MRSEPEPSAPENPRRRWFARLAAVGGLGLLSAQAHAHGWGRRGALDPEEMARRLDYRVGRLVRDVGGTQQQKDRLVAIALAAQADLRPLRDQRRQARLLELDLLAAPVIDRVALERARVARMQAADARSRRVLQARADAAEVLTPEQRSQLAARLKQRIERHQRG